MRPLRSSSHSARGRGDALAHPVRRRVVAVLARQSTPTPVTSLVDELLVGASEPVAVDRLPGTRRHLYASLRRRHLPALADAGVVRYDAAEDVVALTDGGWRVGRRVA